MMMIIIIVILTLIVAIIIYCHDVEVEQTYIGPYAVRSDVEHQINHNAKDSIFFCKPRFQLIRRRRLAVGMPPTRRAR